MGESKIKTNNKLQTNERSSPKGANLFRDQTRAHLDSTTKKSLHHQVALSRQQQQVVGLRQQQQQQQHQLQPNQPKEQQQQQQQQQNKQAQAKNPNVVATPRPLSKPSFASITSLNRPQSPPVVSHYGCQLAGCHLKCTRAKQCTCCKTSEVFFPPFKTSPRGGPSRVYKRILEILEQAKRSICLSMHRLTFSKFTDELLLAHKRGVKVRVIADWPMLEQYPNDSNSQRTSKQNHLKQLIELIRAGIVVKCSTSSGKENALMHHKFAIVDGEILIEGSMNWTWFGQFRNHEHVTITRSLGMIQSFAVRFDELCVQMEQPKCRFPIK